ncbi:MAG: ribosome maturation factor RimP [Anaerofustis sp.]
MANRLLDEVVRIAEPIIETANAELVDAEYLKEGSERIVRLYVGLQEGNISLDELAELNRKISDGLDESDVTEESYTLEISSPGVNRPLKKERDYLRFRGSKVDVSLYESVDGLKKFTCVLTDYNNGIFLFTNDRKQIEISADKVAKINLHFEF